MNKENEGINVLSLFDGKYEVTEDGLVYSNVGTRKALVGKTTREGYRMVVLTVDNKKIYKNVHRLVAENFLPNPENKPEINHKDGDKLNNKVSNLEWCTSSENQEHARDMGLQKYKINIEIAEEIRELYSTGNWTHVNLGLKFGLKKTNIGYIINNQRWVK